MFTDVTKLIMGIAMIGIASLILFILVTVIMDTYQRIVSDIAVARARITSLEIKIREILDK